MMSVILFKILLLLLKSLQVLVQVPYLNLPSLVKGFGANVFTLGSLAPNSQIYLYQNDALIILGGIRDISNIPYLVRESGNLIDAGNVTILARKYTSLFDHYTADLVTGAGTPIPIATFNDTANTTGYRTFTGSSGSGTFLNKEIIQKTGDATVQGIVTAVSGTSSDPIITYYLFKYPFTDITASDAITGLTSNASCTAGAPSNTGPASLSGITLDFGATSQDLNNGANARPYDVIINCNDNSLASTYEYLKTTHPLW